jgi:tetratricopeptide (TPR) repeat protein
MTAERDAALAAVRGAYKTHEFARARELVDAFVQARPDDADGWLWTGIVALAQSRYEDAGAAFQRKVDLAEDAWTYVQLGLCHWKTGGLHDAWRAYTRAVEVAPSAEAYVGLATVLHGLESFDEALRALDAAERLSPQLADVPLRRGCTLLEMARYEEAQSAFGHALALTGGQSIVRFLAFDRATYDALMAGRLEATQPGIALERGTDRARAVVQVSCDPTYLRKYGHAFVRSYAKQAEAGERLHVHVYDPDASAVAELDGVAAAAGLRAYTVSIEASPYASAGEWQRKAYYAAARIAHLPFWLQRFDAPVVALDVDLIVEAPLAGLLARNPRADLRLNRRDPPIAPWLDAVANVIVAYPTPAAALFFTCAGIFALERIARDPEPWLMDQMSLFCVFRMFERYGSALKVEWIANAHDLGMWHLGHPREYLLSDPRFTAHT